MYRFGYTMFMGNLLFSSSKSPSKKRSPYLFSPSTYLISGKNKFLFSEFVDKSIIPGCVLLNDLAYLCFFSFLMTFCETCGYAYFRWEI